MLRNRPFRYYWAGLTLSIGGTAMRQAAIAWQIYTLTHSPLALGLIGLSRLIPIVLFSLLAGVVADVLNRRMLLLATQCVMLLVSAVLAITTLTGTVSVPMIYLLTALGAGVSAFDSPARQTVVPSLVAGKDLTNALSLTNTAWELAYIAGPAAAGLLIASSGVGTVYAIDAASYLAMIGALLAIRIPPVEGAAQRISLQAAMEGLRFVFHSPIILSTTALDFVATFFGSATALLPIFASDILHVGPEGYGVLYAAPSAGAILAGLVMTWHGRRIRAHGRMILIAVAAYATFTLVFGLSRVAIISCLALAGVGASDLVSTTLRQTIRQLSTPDALRGRMSSVSMVFFMGGPQLGEMEAGVVARGIGAPLSVVTGGIAALATTGLIAYYARGLRKYAQAESREEGPETNRQMTTLPARHDDTTHK